MLESSAPNTFSGCEPTPDPPVILDGEPEYEIAEILNSKVNRHCKCKLQYLIHWAGYEGTNEETSWLLASELGHALEVISDFHQAYLEKPGPQLWLWFSSYYLILALLSQFLPVVSKKKQLLFSILGYIDLVTLSFFLHLLSSTSSYPSVPSDSSMFNRMDFDSAILCHLLELHSAVSSGSIFQEPADSEFSLEVL